MRPTGIMPALLTRIVGGPKASVAVATTAVQRSSSRTSSGSKRAAPPSRAASASPPSRVDVGDHDAGPLGHEQLRLRRPLPPGGPGDERDPSVEPTGHPSIPVKRSGSERRSRSRLASHMFGRKYFW